MPAYIHENIENVKETPKKIVSLQYWAISLLDAVMIGGIGAIVGNGGLAAFDLAEFNARTLAVLFAAGAIVKIGDFWRSNPLAHIVKK